MVVETAVSFSSKDIILAHNHPNGFAVPSTADIKATQEFISVLEPIGVNLADHIIVSKDDCFSMAKSKKYSHLFG
jgi:DNA repair protein RadC